MASKTHTNITMLKRKLLYRQQVWLVMFLTTTTQ